MGGRRRLNHPPLTGHARPSQLQLSWKVPVIGDAVTVIIAYSKYASDLSSVPQLHTLGAGLVNCSG